MKSCDLLTEIFKGTMTIEDAEELVDGILNSAQAASIKDILCLSSTEWAAYVQGTNWLDISNWRHKGWPNKCINCNQIIDIENFGWWIIERDGKTLLKHIRCPNLA